jgi:hypothetical protein
VSNIEQNSIPPSTVASTGSRSSFLAEWRVPHFDLRLFSAIMTLCGPRDVTLQELRVETWFPADQDSERCWLQNFGECAGER